jgi:hypothetical protein
MAATGTAAVHSPTVAHGCMHVARRTAVARQPRPSAPQLRLHAASTPKGGGD